MNNSPVPRSPLSSGQRLGFHYFSDTLHYREIDLNTWVPRLQGLGAAWLVLQSETDRAIPEAFIGGLLQAGIEPIIHFKQGIDAVLDLREIRPLLESYARWGARYVMYYDRPNARSSWQARGWVQQDLVKNFLERFLPAANLSAQQGLVTIFSPLEPGGSYWDTAFLRSVLQEMVNRQQDQVLRSLALSAYAWTGGHSLNWGAGGPEHWPLSRPYHTPPNSQDQKGFRVFDWYQAVVQDVLQRTVPIFLLQAGCSSDPEAPASRVEIPQDEESYARECTVIARLLAGETVTDAPDGDGKEDEVIQPVPSQVVAGCFWLLSAEPGSRDVPQAWFQPQPPIIRIPAEIGIPEEDEKAGEWLERPVCASLRALRMGYRETPGRAKTLGGKQAGMDQHPLRHYLLLPGHEWGVADWYLEITRPFIKKHRPTVGFSVAEARLAAHVTVIGQVPGFTREVLDDLQKSGCEVDWIEGDGTTLATLLAER